jgi:hypothetical protein
MSACLVQLENTVSLDVDFPTEQVCVPLVRIQKLAQERHHHASPALPVNIACPVLNQCWDPAAVLLDRFLSADQGPPRHARHALPASFVSRVAAVLLAPVFVPLVVFLLPVLGCLKAVCHVPLESTAWRAARPPVAAEAAQLGVSQHWDLA